MAYVAPAASELFSDATSKAEVAQRFEDYKESLSKAHSKASGGSFIPGVGIVKTEKRGEAILERVANLEKSLTGDSLTSVQAEIDSMKSMVSELNKEWSITVPNSTGLVPYDLEAPAKLLVPRLTPLRNSLTRTKGVGTARQFKRITGWSNSGVGGNADLSPFMNSQAAITTYGSANGNNVALRRGQNISYTSDSKTVSYREMGFSDVVDWQAQFAGQGFQDIRQLSQTALLWAHFGGEERAILFGRGTTGNGFAGTVAAPVITVTLNTDSTGALAAGAYLVKVTAFTGFGETAVSNEPVAVTADATHTSFTVNVTTEPVGALYYKLYVTAAGGATGTETFQTTFVGNSFVFNKAVVAGAANPGATNTSADANSYDGFLTVLTDPTQSGYVNRVNAKLSTSNPGDEFQKALLSLYQSVKADPEEIYTDATVIKQAGDLFKTASSANYRIDLDGGSVAGGYKMGSAVTGLVNQVTQRMVDLRVHPYIPTGTAIIRSRTLPVPDSNVSETSQVVNVQDYMAVDWPVIQYTYDQSTYQYGSLVHYAPAWSGALVGIQS